MKTKSFIIGLFLFSFIFPTMQAQTYRIAVIPKGEKKWGYMNLKGEIIVSPQSWIGYPSTKYGTVLTTPTGFTTSRKTLYDKDGNEIITEIKVKLYSNQWSGEVYGFVGDMLRQKQDGKWGAMNSKGKITVPLVYDELTDFDSGYALGKRDKRFYVVDTDGNETPIERNDEITYIKQFSEGLAQIELNNKRFGFVDTLGKIVIEPEYFSVGNYSGGFAWVRVMNKTIGFINKRGEWIIEPQFDVVKKGFDKESGMSMVQNNSLDTYWSFVDTTGKIHDFKLAEKYYDFSEGLALGRLNKKYGYLNNKGVWAIMPVFDGATDFNNGYAAAKLGKHWGIINKKGEWVLQPEYKAIGEVVKIE